DRGKMPARDLLLLVELGAHPRRTRSNASTTQPSNSIPGQPATKLISWKATRASVMVALDGGQQNAVDIRELVVTAANDSSDHAEAAEAMGVSMMTIDELDEEITRIAREFLHADPVPVFQQMVRTRDRIYRLLDIRQYPRQTSQLYYMAGKLCCLLGD